MAHENLTTLCYIEREDSYLMLHRISKKNDMNRDKWLGVGGHLENGESPEECLLREVKEETGLTLLDYKLRGVVTFVSDRYPDEYMFLYTADRYEGDLTDCSEGQLEWVKKEGISELSLWEGDRIFFELLNDNIPFFSLKLSYKGDGLAAAALNGGLLELLEERNSDGMITGNVRARFMMHRDGTLHGTSHVWILRPNEKSGFDLLLQKRSAHKDAYPGCYDISSAGHIPAGSDFLESALRELFEELGILAKPEELIYVGLHEEAENDVFYGRPFVNHEISRVYVCERQVDERELKLQKEEVESVMWMDYEECLRRMKDGAWPHCLNEKELTMLAGWWKEQKKGLT
ncbi:NUDIX domain-containing protein [Lachnospiraceae bacterium 54-53]